MPTQDFKGTVNGNTITPGTGTLTMAAGKILTVSDTFTLALGAANLKYFMNSAGTGPEWGGGYKIGTLTYDTSTVSGTQVITGVGFKPSQILIFAALDATFQTSIGLSDGTNQYCLYNYGYATPGAWRYNTTNAILLQESGTNIASGTIAPMGSDGFTINWTKAGTKTGTATLFYIAIR